MENCEYTRVLLDIGIEKSGYNNNTWKSVMRQCLITSGVCCVYFIQGLFLGAPTVLAAQIRRDVNSTEIITDEMLSWLTTFPAIGSVPFMVILPLLFNRIGRKLTFLFVCSASIVSFIIFYNSNNLYHILISALFTGPALASTGTIAPVIIAEYTSPKYRGILLPLKGATAFWGIWISNAIGTFFHWKNIAIVAFVCSVYLITVMAWPESPYWLAKRGRYAESAKSHRWLKGVDENSEKELAQLIISQKNFNNAHLTLEDGFCSFAGLSRMWSIIKISSFYKPVLICITLIAQYNFTGKLVISMYAIQVLRHLTPDESFVYKDMLILDGVTVLSMYIGCIISRYFKRRTLLLFFSGTGITVLFTMSLYLYLASLSVVVENDVVVLLLLTVYSAAIGCGPIILCTTIYGEIIPPRYQNPAMIFVSVGGITSISILLKISPFMFENLKMQGSFLFYAISSSILLCVLYFHLPETKNKTILEIEQYFTKNQMVVEQDKAPVNRDVELNSLIAQHK